MKSRGRLAGAFGPAGASRGSIEPPPTVCAISSQFTIRQLRLQPSVSLAKSGHGRTMSMEHTVCITSLAVLLRRCRRDAQERGH